MSRKSAPGDQSLDAMRRFLECVQAGEAIDRWVASSLARSFRQIVEGQSLEQAFKDSWPLPTDTEIRNGAIHSYIEYVLKPNRRGEKGAAIQSAAEHFNVSYSTAREAYYFVERRLEAMRRSEDEQLAPFLSKSSK